MILGYVDAEDRLYDLNFATLRMKLVVESAGGSSVVVFSQAQGRGEGRYAVRGEAGVTATAAMDHDGHEVPLLRPVEGRLFRHDAGVLFLAEPKRRDPEDPGFYLVKVRAMPSAVKFFFEDQEGQEIVSIPRDEVVRTERTKDAVRVFVSAAGLALPNEKIAYLVEFRPRARAEPLLVDLPGPPSG